MSARRVNPWPGRPYPLGATWDGGGVNFAIFSEHAERVELCLFDPKGRREIAQINIPWQTDFIWHCYLPDARPGLLYGYRVYGAYDPERGYRFNGNKLLIDPYARMLVGDIQWSDAQFGYRIGAKQEDLSLDRRNGAAGMVKCRVVDGAFTWGDDAPPRTPWSDTVIYELHVKGFTQQHPDVPALFRGTFAGVASEPAIAHLKSLGVTAVELMPIHAFLDDRHLLEKGLRNYWGYNSLGFFAPDMRYCASGNIGEFKSMVKRLHSAGIEVILDVVYNHTAEGNHLGPTLSFRGIDNLAYYRLMAKSPRYYNDFTGCGNTLNMMHPQVLQLVMDSLRYWVQEMHVDGFRFDLASALARELQEVDQNGAFLDIIHQDPVLSQVKLIAEPWDLGEHGYQVGNFPVRWSEWNGRYRDSVRAFWKGESGLIGDVGSRLSGSSDLYQAGGRKPYASINFVTVHDGFTLQDLVSFNQKHNDANREGNLDGSDHNISWNCGVEGASDDVAINALRARQKRNLIATLLLSQGVPMLLGGDELGHTQQGNNNAYCQDSALSWLNWQLTAPQQEFLKFVRSLIALRRAHPALRRMTFFRGRTAQGAEDIVWWHPEGRAFTEHDWQQANADTLGMLLNGGALDDCDAQGRPLRDDDFLVLFNAGREDVEYAVPETAQPWRLVVDTSVDAGIDAGIDAAAGLAQCAAIGARYVLVARSVAVLQRAQGNSEHASPP